jgi:dTDP-4-amino-4,6-dideoxygalactose transaminase
MSSPDLSDRERQAVADVLNTPVLSMGEQNLAFEQAISEYSGSAHAIAVSSGTAGLHLCVRAAGIEQGDLVLTTPFSFVASSNVLLYEKAVPVFVDVDPESGNIDAEQLARAVEEIMKGGKDAQGWLPRRGAETSAKLKAILPVDVFGQPANYSAIKELSDKYDLAMIEDSCEAIGAQHEGRMAGRFGDSAVFAFYPNKQMTTGEGGVIVTDDQQTADFMRSLRNQGRALGDTWLEHTHLGYNYRLTELSAVLGRIQLSRLDEFLQKREQVAAWYTERLSAVEAIETPVVDLSTTRMSWFLFVIRLAEGIQRDQIIRKLEEKGIPSRAYFSPIHLQPYMRDLFGYQEGDFPITEDLGKRSLALPFSSIMTEEQVEIVCEELVQLL